MKSEKLQKRKLKEFADKHNIKFIILFGSQSGLNLPLERRKRNSKQDSDFDIAISMEDFNNLENYTNILFGLSEILEIPLEKIDLTNLNSANTLLKYEIVLNGKLLYGDEIRYAGFQSLALRLYIDAQRLRDLEKSLIFKRQRLLAKEIYGNSSEGAVVRVQGAGLKIYSIFKPL